MTSSLFGSVEVWQTQPAIAFEALISSPEFQLLSRRQLSFSSGENELIRPQPMKNSSVIVYRAMWAKYLRWLSERNLTLFDVSSADLLAFLNQQNEKGRPERSSLIKLRYLRIFERIYTYLKIPMNPARHAMFDAIKSGKQSPVGRDDDKVYLTDAQQEAFMKGLPAPNNWKRRRDRAMQAMMLGAGLKVSEVIGLQIDQIGELVATDIPITISALKDGKGHKHQAMLRPFAVAEIIAWLQERRLLSIPGTSLFPATLQGGLLNHATVYRNVKKTFAAAGIDVLRKGGRTLRNAYAIRELESQSVEKVGELLGHRKRRSTEYYLLKPIKQRL